MDLKNYKAAAQLSQTIKSLTSHQSSHNHTLNAIGNNGTSSPGVFNMSFAA